MLRFVRQPARALARRLKLVSPAVSSSRSNFVAVPFGARRSFFCTETAKPVSASNTTVHGTDPAIAQALNEARQAFAESNFQLSAEKNQEAVKLADDGKQILLPELATARVNAAYALKQLCKYEEARVECDAGLQVLCKEYNSYKPAVAATLDLLAELCVALGDLDDAAKHAERAIEIRSIWGNNDSTALATSYNVLGAVRLEQGDRAEARRAFREALRLHVLQENPNWPSKENQADVLSVPSAVALSNYAGILRKENKTAGCIEALRCSAEAFEANLGEEDPIVGMVLCELGATLVRDAQFNEAAEPLRKSLAILTKAYGFQHPHTLAAIEWSAHCANRRSGPSSNPDAEVGEGKFDEGSADGEDGVEEIRELIAEVRAEARKAQEKAAEEAAKRPIMDSGLAPSVTGHVGMGNPAATDLKNRPNPYV